MSTDPLAEPPGYGKLGRIAHLAGKPAPPDESPAGEGWISDGICDVREADGKRCTHPRSAHWITGCVHEHVQPFDLCPRHAYQLEAHIRNGWPLMCNAPGCRARQEVQKVAAVLADGTLQWRENGRIGPRPAPRENMFEGEDHA